MNIVNQAAGSIRRLKDGRWQASIILGEGRGAAKKTRTVGTKREATAWLAAAKKTGVPSGDAAAMTVAAAFDAYLDAKVLARNSVEIYTASRRRAVAQGIGSVKLAALKPSQVAAFTAYLDREGFAPSTTNNYAAKLSAVLRFAAADGAMTFMPSTVTVRHTPTKKEAITPADVKALYEASSDWFAPAILLGAYAGMRASEVCAVTVADIDFLRGTIAVTNAIDRRGNYVATKTARSVRTIPVPAQVLAELATACAGKLGDAPVATNAYGGILSTGSFAKIFAKVAVDAGLEITSHALRKFFATSLLAAHVNPVSVARWLGDTVQVMLATYALEQATDADDARDALAAAFAATVAA